MTTNQLLVLLGCWALVAILGGSVTWVFRPARPGWPPSRTRAVPWDGFHVLAVFVVMEIGPLFVMPRLPHGGPANVILVRLLATPLLLAISVAGILLLTAARPYQFGCPPPDCRRDWRHGYLLWLMTTPGVYLIYVAAVWAYQLWVGEAPAEHPLIRFRGENPGRIDVFVLIGLVAVVEAPLREEFLFRGLLLPVCERSMAAGDATVAAASVIGLIAAEGRAGAVPFFAVTITFYLLVRFHEPLPQRLRAGITAVIANALLFAAFHAPVWPTPVPLFFLGLALAQITRRTRRIWPAIIAHFLFNLVSIVALWLR